MTVASGGTLDLNGFNQTVSSVTNAGLVNMGTGTAPGTVLTTTSYTGSWRNDRDEHLSGGRRFAVGQACHQRRQRDRQFVVAHHQCGRPRRRDGGNGIAVVQAINGGTTAPGAFSLANPTSSIDVGFLPSTGCSTVASAAATLAIGFCARTSRCCHPHQRTPPTTPTTADYSDHAAYSPTTPPTDTQRAPDIAPDRSAAGPAAAWHLSDHWATGGHLWRGAADRPADGSHHARHAA